MASDVVNIGSHVVVNDFLLLLLDFVCFKS